MLRKLILTSSSMTFVSLLEAIPDSAIGLIMAKMGTEELAASTLISSSQLFLLITSTAVLHSVGGKIREANTDETKEKIGTIWHRGLIIATVTSTPVALILGLGIGPILRGLGQKTSLVSISEDFFRGYALGVIPRAWIRCNQQLLFGLDHISSVVAVRVTNLLLFGIPAYCLTFGKLGSPKYGTAGLGYAFTIQAYLGSLLFFAFLKFHKFEQFNLFSRFTLEPHTTVRTLWNIGWPISLEVSIELVSVFLTTIIIGHLGKTAMAANQIATSVNILTFDSIFGVSQAVSFSISGYWGEREYGKIRAIVPSAIPIIEFIPIISLILSFLLVNQITSLYVSQNDELYGEIARMNKWILPITSTMLVIDAMKNLYFGSLSGLYDTLVPSLITIPGSLPIGLLSSLLLSHGFGLGIRGVITGQTVGILMNATMLGYRWHTKTKNDDSIHTLATNPNSFKYRELLFWKTQNVENEGHDRHADLHTPLLINRSTTPAP